MREWEEEEEEEEVEKREGERERERRDEKRANAPLIWDRDDLNNAETTRANELTADIKILLQVLMPNRFKHLDRNELVEASFVHQLRVPLQLAVVAKHEVDKVREPCFFDAAFRDIKLLG